MTAAEGHRWMGKPLSAYPDEELWQILAALEAVRFGGPKEEHDRLHRWEIIEAIAEIDADLARMRAGGAKRALAAGRDEGRVAA